MDDIRLQQPLSEFYQLIRNKTEALCQPLLAEDYVIQSMPDVSPAKWHLAHTTWFFETFILLQHDKKYKALDPLYAYLFNSYYNGVGEQFPRSKRGLLSRPSVDKIYDYRNHIDKALLKIMSDETNLHRLIELGLQHEQQHQELLLMDIKHNFFMNPDFPAYQKQINNQNLSSEIRPLNFFDIEGGLIEIGHKGSGFCYDNELPLHKEFLYPFRMANRLITNGEYLDFIETGGYQDPAIWLVEGWAAVQNNHWRAPLYWIRKNSEWYEFTLHGLKKLNLTEPVCHISYYEAKAFATWKKMRLPTEAEWEYFVRNKNITSGNGNFVESQLLHPNTCTEGNTQAIGDLWEWTESDYSPYPGFQPLKGIIGEYNGKFMNNQKVLRGGSCITPQSHIRPSYRNYFGPDKRWVFSGIRLASDS